MWVFLEITQIKGWSWNYPICQSLWCSFCWYLSWLTKTGKAKLCLVIIKIPGLWFIFDEINITEIPSASNLFIINSNKQQFNVYFSPLTRWVMFLLGLFELCWIMTQCTKKADVFSQTNVRSNYVFLKNENYLFIYLIMASLCIFK